jgi:hypothetical protein
VHCQLEREEFVAGQNIRYERVDAYEHQAFFVYDVAGSAPLKIHPIIPAAVSLFLKRQAIRRAEPTLFRDGITSIDVVLRPEWPEDRFVIWERMIEFSGGNLATTRQFREPPSAMEGLHVIGVRDQPGYPCFALTLVSLGHACLLVCRRIII